MFLAKSHPIESIQEHTEALLQNLEILRKVHPNPEHVDWELLELACIYHDLGKMNPLFQEKIQLGTRPIGEVPHNYLSTAFVDTRTLVGILGKDRLKIMINAIAYHHDRAPYVHEAVAKEIEPLQEATKAYRFRGKNYDVYKPVSRKYLTNSRIREDEAIFWEYTLVKGLLNRLDYAASAHIPMETNNDFLVKGLEQLGYEWNDLQCYLQAHQEDNVVVVAETGMGKTEGALLWIGSGKGFFTLPIRTAINAIYHRIRTQIIDEDHQKNVSLLHSDAQSELLKAYEYDTAQAHYNITRQLAMPLTVTTIDQLFKFVFRHKNFESTLATLSYSKVVIDEIQMYEPSLLAYLMYGLKLITHVGGKFAILTATFPDFLYAFMKQEQIPYVCPSKPFISEKKRHHVSVLACDFDYEFMLEKMQGKKTLIICNTIKKAKEVYVALSERGLEQEIKLLHSQFIKCDRDEKEVLIKRDSEEESPVIWISTQIVEASLDIDFDVLFTELSDLAGLFQRLGRCNRKGSKSIVKPNCFVFLGKNGKCTGVGSFIDETLYQLSKEAIKKINGVVSEEDKLALISHVYATEKIKNSTYYEQFLLHYDRLKILTANTLSKKEVDQMFRNINSISGIPKPIYEQNYSKISTMIKAYEKGGETPKETHQIRTEILIKMNRFLVSLPEFRKKQVSGDLIFEGTYTHCISILDCAYDDKVGVQFSAVVDQGNFDW